MLNLLFNAI